MKAHSRIISAMAVSALLLPTFLSSHLAHAETAEEAARALVAPFYDALNAGTGKDTAALIKSATTPEWVSCSSNEGCGPRDAVIQGMMGLEQAVPDLKWTIKQVIVAGNQIVVRGEASGTPAGDFMGVPHGGKSFKIMSTDIHTVENGKITKSFHVEDWMEATRQLAGK
jgi:predicted ester cyclase